MEIDDGIDVVDDESCLVWSANLKQTNDRLQHILAHTKTLRRPPEIIAIQDSPAALPFRSTGAYTYWCRATDDRDGKKLEITGDDNSNYYPFKPPYSCEKMAEKREPKALSKVAFLVHGTLSKWYVTKDAQGLNRRIVATLQLPTNHGLISIHNVYNHLCRLDVAALMENCRESHAVHVLVGDFNWHYQLWGGKNLAAHKVEPAVKKLVSLMEELKMVCKNEPGVVTHSRGSQISGKFSSTLDLVVVDAHLSKQAQYHFLDNVTDFTSDHRISTLNIDMKMERKEATRYLYSKTPRDEYERFVSQRLDGLQLVPRPDAAVVAHVLDVVINDTLVPALDVFGRKPDEHIRVHSDRTVRTRKWHEAVTVMARSRRGVFPLARRARNWDLPRRMAYTPDFTVGSRTYRTNEEKAECFVKATWSQSRPKGPPRACQNTGVISDNTFERTWDRGCILIIGS